MELDYILSRYRTTRQTSVRMTHEMKEQVEKIVRETYGARGVSRWVEESLAAFTSNPNALLRVGAGEDGVDFPALKIFRLTPVSDDYLRDMAGKVLRIDPLAHNAKSQILRAAFRHAIKEYERKHAATGKKVVRHNRTSMLRLEEQPRMASTRKPAQDVAEPSASKKDVSNG